MHDADKTAEKQRVVGIPFPKGISGNPAGRPKGSISIKDRIRQYLEENPKDMVDVVKYFVKENRELMWTMLEGNPKSASHIEVKKPEVYEVTEEDMLIAKAILKNRKEKTIQKSLQGV